MSSLTLNPRMLLPICTEQQRHRLARRVHDGDAPDQDTDLEIGPALDQLMQELAERLRSSGEASGRNRIAPSKSQPTMTNLARGQRSAASSRAK